MDRLDWLVARCSAACGPGAPGRPPRPVPPPGTEAAAAGRSAGWVRLAAQGREVCPATSQNWAGPVFAIAGHSPDSPCLLTTAGRLRAATCSTRSAFTQPTAFSSSNGAPAACRRLAVSPSPGSIGSNGKPLNPQAISASAIYRAAFAVNGRMIFWLVAWASCWRDARASEPALGWDSGGCVAKTYRSRPYPVTI